MLASSLRTMFNSKILNVRVVRLKFEYVVQISIDKKRRFFKKTLLKN